MEELKQTIEQIVKETCGTWAIVFEDIDKQKIWAMNEDRSYTAASIIKLPIMAAVFSMADQGKIRLSDTLEVKREDLVGGAGVLQHLTPGVELTIYDLVTLMIIQSDNTATNMIIEKVGCEQIQQTMKQLEMNNSFFFNKLMTVPVKAEGRNQVTARDVSTFLKRTVKGQFSSYYACEKMIDIMKRQQIHYLSDGFPENNLKHIGVQPDWVFASKTGHVADSYHDAGILYLGNRTVTIAVFSENCDKNTALFALSRIGKEIYTYVSKTQ